MYRVVILVLLLIAAFSRNNATVNNADKYIYLSHTRISSNVCIYNKVYDIDFSKYKMTLLGGDIALKSFANPRITERRGSILILKVQQPFEV